MYFDVQLSHDPSTWMFLPPRVPVSKVGIFFLRRAIRIVVLLIHQYLVKHRRRYFCSPLQWSYMTLQYQRCELIYWGNEFVQQEAFVQ